MELILVYDIRRDETYRKQILSRVEDQWRAYLRGERPVNIAEGRIVELYFDSYEGEHKFKLDEAGHQSSWVRQGEDSWYAVGRTVKIEQALFQVPQPIGEMPVVTRIWIGN